MADPDVAAFLQSINDTNEVPSTVQVEDDDEYDPSNLEAPSAPVAKPSTSIPLQQNGSAKRKGGFVIDDHSDEDSGDVQQSNGLLKNGTSTNPQRSHTGTPINTNVSLTEDQTQVNQAGATLNVSSVSNSRAASSTPLPIAQSPPVASTTEQQRTASISLPKVRLPKDRVGQLEDRIAKDPRGDVNAWLELIHEHRQKNRLDDARAVFKRYFDIFPSATTQWLEYAKMELENEDFYRLETIYGQALPSNPNVQLWSQYLNYILRRNNLTTDTSGEARQVIQQSYDFVLKTLGIDKDAGTLWQNYIEFLKTGPGTVGGPDWKDQQKMDTIRKVYRQAVGIPTQANQELWTSYHQFETSLNKQTANKFMQDRTASFLTAKEAYFQLSKITRNLLRDTLPRLPPAIGFEGDVEYLEQVSIWKEWIQWEHRDPLEHKADDPAEFVRRVVYVYRQATMTMPFEPEFWLDASEFCFNNNMETEGSTFLSQGIEINPESSLLAFKKADRVEASTTHDDAQEALVSRGAAVRAPYDKLLDALYALQKSTLERQEKSIERIDESFAGRALLSATEDSEEEREEVQKQLDKEREQQISAIKSGCQAQIDLIRQLITSAWVALMRAMRRVQGKGTADVNAAIGGSRRIFAQGRKRGSVKSDLYIAAALMEHYCYKDPAAGNIFKRGTTLFPQDESFSLEYLKYLININDSTNARAVFETSVSKLTAKPETTPKAKALFAFMHNYESNYGDLAQMSKLEKRMAALFPGDPQLSRFERRFDSETSFNPTKVIPIISLTTQARPKTIHPSIEHGTPSSVQQVTVPQGFIPGPFSPRASPRPALAGLSVHDAPHRQSPKRPFPEDLSYDSRPNKVARGESPLKGAAGRRLDAAKRRLEQQGGGVGVVTAQTPSLPPMVNFLLGILPDAKYAGNLARLNNITAVMAVLRAVNFSNAGGQSGGTSMARGASAGGYQPPTQQTYGYPPR